MAVTQLKIYQSWDPGAPVLTGQVGSFLAVLNAILVNGYGSKASAGWTKPFADGTNIGSFRQGGGNRIYMDVIDNAVGGTSGPTAYEAGYYGYETMTAPSTGTGKFSYTATVNIFLKSITADATARRWICFADDATLYFFSQNGAVNNLSVAYWSGCQFGEFYSFVPNDQCRNYIVSRSNTGGTAYSWDYTNTACYINQTIAGYMLQRAWGGAGATSIAMGIHCDAAKSSDITLVKGGMPGAVSLSDNTQWIAPTYIHENLTASVRGRRKGWWQYCHDHSKLSCGQIIQGSNELAGRQFMVISPVGVDYSAVLIEITNTVERN